MTKYEIRKKYLSDEMELRQLKGTSIVTRHVIYAMGAGLIPIPAVDMGLSTAIQLKMLVKLSRHYNVKFTRNIGKSLIATLVGFITTNTLRASGLAQLVKMIPVVGGVAAISMSIYNGAVTHAIGKIFLQHFEAGGTFLTFKPEKVKKHFYELYKEGLEIATKLNGEKKEKNES